MPWLFTLGEPRVEIGPGVTAGLTTRACLLLAIVVCEAPRRVSKVGLIDLLWGADPTPATRHSLSQLIYEIKAKVGVRLSVSESTIGIAESESLCSDFTLLTRDAPDAATVMQLLTPGEFLVHAKLSHPSFNQWRDGKSAALNRSIMRLMAQHLSSEQRMACWHKAVAIADCMLRIDPFDERAWEGKIRAEVADGSLLEAEASLKEAARLFWQELGTPLPKSLVSLEDLLRRAGLAAVDDSMDTSISTQRLPFDGRREELAAIRRSWKMTLNDHLGGMVVICGEAGMGKSRCAERIQREVALDGVRSIKVTCDEIHRNTPYAFAYSFIRRCNPARLDADFKALFSPTLEGLAHSLISPIAVAHRLIDIADSAIGDTPTLLIFEDLHWVDEASVAAIRHLIQTNDDKPYLWMLTARVEGAVRVGDLASLWSRSSGGNPLFIDIGPLSRETIAAICSAWARQRSLPPLSELAVDAAYRFSSGNPALLSLWLSGAQTKEDVAGRELSGVAEPALQTLRALAVIGGSCSRRTLSSASNLSGHQFESTLDELKLLGVIRTRGVLVEFTQDVFRQYMEQQLTEEEKDEMTRRVAVAGLGASVVRRAQQALLTKNSRVAFEHCIEAAAVCAATGAMSEAEYFLNAALQFARHDSQRGRALRALAELFLDRDRLQDARVCLSECSRYETGSDLEVAVRYLDLREDLRSLRQPARLLAASATDLLQDLASLRQKTLLTHALGAAIDAAHDVGDADGVLQALKVISDSLESFSNGKDRAILLGSAARVTAVYGSPYEALAFGRRALAEARHCGDDLAVVHALMGYGTALLSAGRITASLRHFSRALRITTVPKAFHYRVRVLNNYGVAALEGGYLDRAKALFSEGTAMATGHDQLYFCGNLSLVELYLGNSKEAARWIDGVLTLNGSFHSLWAEAFALAMTILSDDRNSASIPADLGDKLVAFAELAGAHHLVICAAARVLVHRDMTLARSWVERLRRASRGRNLLHRARLRLLYARLTSGGGGIEARKSIEQWARRRGANLLAREAQSGEVVPALRT